jgi:mRNA-degrading endonuclease HigB of HigAB toxin-antitoxin module
MPNQRYKTEQTVNLRQKIEVAIANGKTTIKYKWKMVYIRRILSHVEYDEKEWQKS